MLDKYLKNKIDDNNSRISQLLEKINHLSNEELSAKQLIASILEQEDVGLELFSPRGSDETVRERVAHIQKQIEQSEMQRIHLEEEIAAITKENDGYHEMRQEIAARDKSQYNFLEPIVEKDGVEDVTDEILGVQHTEELKIILSRVEKSLSLINSNKNQCKNELTNLKYYIKALITNYSR